MGRHSVSYTMKWYGGLQLAIYFMIQCQKGARMLLDNVIVVSLTLRRGSADGVPGAEAGVM